MKDLVHKTINQLKEVLSQIDSSLTEVTALSPHDPKNTTRLHNIAIWSLKASREMTLANIGFVEAFAETDKEKNLS